MKIAIATPILYDKTSPFNHLFKDILESFLDAGHEVMRFVACRDDKETDYMYGFDKIEYIKFIRKESAHGNIISRYIRDTLTNIRQARALKKSDADVLFEDVSYSSFWAVRAAKKKGMRVLAMLQDVWPDNAVQSGIIKSGGLLYRYFERFQRYVYKRADKIICISDDMKDFIAGKGVDENKIEVIYNWGYSDETVNILWEENRFVQKYGLDKDFYAVYAGNIGKMQNVQLVLRAAKKLPHIKFLIIGDGAERGKIERKAAEIPNVTMLPMQPPELAKHIYSMAGVNIIPLVEGGPKTAMPSKTGIVLSCGRPVIFCFGTGTGFSEIIEEYGAGASVSATDEDELARESDAESKSNQEVCGGAYEVFKKLFSRKTNMKQYEKALKSWENTI